MDHYIGIFLVPQEAVNVFHVMLMILMEIILMKIALVIFIMMTIVIKKVMVIGRKESL